MNQDVIHQAVLNSQRKPIEPRIVIVPLTGVHVVRGEHHFFAEQLIVENQERSIEQVEFVVPQDVKDLRLSYGSITNQAPIVT